jgi:hypothetical protein
MRSLYSVSLFRYRSPGERPGYSTPTKGDQGVGGVVVSVKVTVPVMAGAVEGCGAGIPVNWGKGTWEVPTASGTLLFFSERTVVVGALTTVGVAAGLPLSHPAAMMGLRAANARAVLNAILRDIFNWLCSFRGGTFWFMGKGVRRAHSDDCNTWRRYGTIKA